MNGHHAGTSNKVDVFICGSGSAGLSTATWLARCGIRCKIVDSRPGPLVIGQADGAQVRTVEIFESFGLAEELLRLGYHNIEVSFWNPGEKGSGIVRTRSAAATHPGLSHLPRVILSQAKFNGLLLDAMKRFSGQEVDYGHKVVEVLVDEEKANDMDAYPVTIVTEKNGEKETFKAKYALGSDGAHSIVRRSLGFKMVGDSSDTVWGVIDIFARTTFPDIRKQVVIQSEAGTLIIIPREGGSLNRFYIELPQGTIAKNVTLEDLQTLARRCFQPYEIEFAETLWWSAYPIGQRLSDHFSKASRVFLTGDACHTHSPKAGQGMNVSFQDGYNIGWKLASILKGQMSPKLMDTYLIERQKVAEILINWDKIWAKQMTSLGKDAGGAIDADGNIDFSEIFVKAEAFTAGLTIKYDESPLTHAEGSKQHLATNIIAGMRFPSAQVVRHCDGYPMQLAKALPSDGRWRIVIFAGDTSQGAAFSKLDQLGKYLFAPGGPILRYTPPSSDIDSCIEVILVLFGARLEIDQHQIPEVFWPATGQWGMRDLHKTYLDDDSYHCGHGHAYNSYGIKPEEGAMVIVRPDNYVSLVLDVDDRNGLDTFFGGCLIPRR